MKLILTRHGQTIENKMGICQGHMPGRLSELGIEQAKKLAKRLKDEKIDVIYSSDLARSADTTKIIAKFHPDTPIHYVKELREFDHGSNTGKHNTEFDWKNPPPDFETKEAVAKRAKKILDQVYDKHPNDTVLFVGHNGVNLALVTVIMNKPPEYMLEFKVQFNTAVNVFEIREDKNHKIHLLNCKKHLD